MFFSASILFLILIFILIFLVDFVIIKVRTVAVLHRKIQYESFSKGGNAYEKMDCTDSFRRSAHKCRMRKRTCGLCGAGNESHKKSSTQTPSPTQYTKRWMRLLQTFPKNSPALHNTSRRRQSWTAGNSGRESLITRIITIPSTMPSRDAPSSWRSVQRHTITICRNGWTI